MPNTVTAPLWDSPFVAEPYQRSIDNKMDASEAENLGCKISF